MGRDHLSPDVPCLVAEIRGGADFLTLVRHMRCVQACGWESAAQTAFSGRKLVLVNSSPEEDWDDLIREFSDEFQGLASSFSSGRSSDSPPSGAQSDLPPEPAMRFRTAGAGDIDADSPEAAVFLTPSVRVVRSTELPDYIPPGSRQSETSRSENFRIDIFLESGWAFGTGSHPSTVCSIMALDELRVTGMLHSRTRVLDMGTGTGILAIAAALMGAGKVVAVDVDPEALRYAALNVRENGVEHAVSVMSSSQWEQQASSGSFDICLANLTPSVASMLMPSMARSLNSEGVLMLAGFRCGAVPAVTELLSRHSLEETARFQRSGWCAVLACFSLT